MLTVHSSLTQPAEEEPKPRKAFLVVVRSSLRIKRKSLTMDPNGITTLRRSNCTTSATRQTVVHQRKASWKR